MENLINWKELSRFLAKNETSITRKRIPKKYQPDVNNLVEQIKNWAENSSMANDLKLGEMNNQDM